MKYQYSSAKNPCPICDRTKDGDCHFNGDVVLCHTFVDADAQKDGYVYREATDCGMWGQYFPAVEPTPKAIRPKATKEFFYSNPEGSPLVRVTRKDDGDGKKTFSQSHWNGKRWVYGLTDEAKTKIHLYRIYDPINQQAITNNQLIFIVEGEGVADTLISLGIPATTAIGGAGKWQGYGYPNYITDLEGARVVICPDRDKKGLQHSAAIAKDFPEAQWCYAIPESPLWQRIPDNGGLDMGDWVADLKRDGLSDEQVRDCILAAVEPRRVALPANQPTEVTESKSTETQKPHFESSVDRGLVWVSFERDEDTGEFKKSKTQVGNHLKAIAYIENTEQSGAALLLEFKTVRGHIRCWQMSRSGLAGNAAALLDELLGRGYGLVYEQTKKLKRYLIELGQGIDQTYTITNKTGWVGNSFALENRTYGDQSIRFLDVEPVKDSAYELRGTLDSWRTEVASLAANNSRLIFGLGVAFAAPLAPVLGVESGGFHLYGPTSTGKTTTLKIASSVVGIPSKEIKCWRATANGLEGVASAHNHLPLHLDEIGQGEPRDVGATAYMLSNGQGKTRARRNGDSAPSKTWDTLFLSSGEVGLSQYLKQAGISVKGGQEIRMPDIPACPDNGQGILESISNFATPADFIRALEGAVERNCGTALDAFLIGLVEDRKSEEWVKEQEKRLWAIAHKLREVAPNEEIIGRVALRFALMQIALEIAHSYGILPFPIEQCGWAVQTLFTDWLNARGGAGSIEIKQACERIEHLFVSNEFGDRIYRVDEVSRDQNVRNLLAYRKTDPLDSSPEFWVPTSVFNSEFCQGIEKTLLIKELLERGWLKPSTQPDRKTVKRRLGTRTLNVYAFRIFWDSCLALGTTGTVGTSMQDKESSRSQPWEHDGNNGNTPEPNADNVPVVPKGEMGAGTGREQQNPCPEIVSDSVPVVPDVPSPQQQNPKNSTLEKIDDDIDWEDIDPSELGGAA